MEGKRENYTVSIRCCIRLLKETRKVNEGMAYTKFHVEYSTEIATSHGMYAVDFCSNYLARVILVVFIKKYFQATV